VGSSCTAITSSGSWANMIAVEGKRLDVVYVGYGISEPDYGWDDLGGLDLEGKAVLFLTGAPTEMENRCCLRRFTSAMYSSDR